MLRFFIQYVGMEVRITCIYRLIYICSLVLLWIVSFVVTSLVFLYIEH